MKDVSIEYAHIYTNNHIGAEQDLSLKVLSEVYEKGDHRTSLVVMVDDYSFPDPTFNYDTFIEWLTKKGFSPDLVFRESQLIPVCDEVLKIMDDGTLKNQIIDYIKAKKYPCSLFIAAWYLLRFGHLESVLFDKECVAVRLLNILPTSFKPFEEKGLDIIRTTPFKSSVGAIEYQYFEGRLVA